MKSRSALSLTSGLSIGCAESSRLAANQRRDDSKRRADTAAPFPSAAVNAESHGGYLVYSRRLK